MLRRIYNALWYPALPFALMASGANDPRDRGERMGAVEFDAAGAERRIWIHAASVGEVEAVRPLAAELGQERAAIIVTTMTTAGRDAARRRIPGAAACVLAPLDSPPAVRRFLAAVRPTLVLIGETELWPNFFIESRRAGARIAVVNGRISERSLRRYRRARSLFARALGAADLILAQSDDDARRFVALGALPDRVIVTGSTKLDLLSEESVPVLRPELENFGAGRPMLIAGSTAAGEETIVVHAYLRLREHMPALALILAPRHPARTPEVEEILRAASIGYVCATDLPPPGAAQDASFGAAALLLNTMGELRALYRRATIAFVGGSLTPGRGGQNVAEPAAFAVPVLFGPHCENQRDLATALVAAGGARVVRDADELAGACENWLADEAARERAGRRARETAQHASGGARVTLNHLKSLMAAPA
jgi:3-deoxy-D-manno-octulosonic-acid transferase